jgi:hypothetical protein
VGVRGESLLGVFTGFLNRFLKLYLPRLDPRETLGQMEGFHSLEGACLSPVSPIHGFRFPKLGKPP